MNANLLRRVNWLWKHRHTHNDDNFQEQITLIKTTVEEQDDKFTSGDVYTSTIVIKHEDGSYVGAAHYVCDGTADDVQFAAALSDLAGTGGEIVVMDGEYDISAAITQTIQGPIRIIGKGARLNLGDGVIITLAAVNTAELQGSLITLEGFEITRAGTSGNRVIRLSTGGAGNELGHVRVVGNHFRDISGSLFVLEIDGRDSALVTGNTFSDITIANNGGVVSKSGTGPEGFIVVTGNGFENISLGGSAGWLLRTSSSNSEGIFTGNAGEGIAVTDLARAADNAFAAHNVINQVHQAGNHGSLDHGGLGGLADDDHIQYLLADGSREATFLAIAGLTGATADSRYVGATASGAPASGTFAVGDYVIAQDGNVYVCTTAGSPGTWTQVGAAAATDADAIHDNVSGEIAAVTEKVTPVSADLILIEDSADTNSKKRVQIGNLPGGSGTDADAIHDNVAGEISALTLVTAASGDHVLIEDASDSNNKKRVAASDFLGGAGGTDDWVKNTLGYPTSIGASDTVWAGSDYSTDFTTVSITGSETITEQNGLLSVKYNSQSSGDLNVGLKTHTFSTGDTFTVPLRLLSRVENFSMAAIVMTDGTTATSNAICYMFYVSSTSNFLQIRHGTLTNMSTGTNNVTDWSTYTVPLPWMFLRLEYDAANSFIADVSVDGISYTNWGAAAVSKTMTPTHIGIGWSKWGGSEEAVATFGPLVKVA